MLSKLYMTYATKHQKRFNDESECIVVRRPVVCRDPPFHRPTQQKNERQHASAYTSDVIWNTWEAYERHPTASEDIWETAEKHQGCVWEAPGTCLWTYSYRIHMLQSQSPNTALSSMYVWQCNWISLDCIGRNSRHNFLT